MEPIRFSPIFYGSSVESDYINEYPSLSIDNVYIPLPSLIEGTLLRGESKILFYHLKIPSPLQIRTTNKYAEFSNRISATRVSILGQDYFYEITHRTVLGRYMASRGILIHLDAQGKPHPLMILAVHKDHLFNINRDNPDPRQFCLIISNDFINNTEHFKVFRNVKKNYIDEASKQFDCLYTNDILGLCYNNKSISFPKFSTLDESIANYKNLNRTLAEVFINL